MRRRWQRRTFWLLLAIALAVLFYVERRTDRELPGYARMLQLAAHPSSKFQLDVDVVGVDAEHFPYHWQTVNSTLDLHVYSAFLDDRGTVKIIRVLGLGSSKLFQVARPAVCYLWSSRSSTQPRVTEGRVVHLKLDRTTLTHTNVECNVMDDVKPYAVSVSTEMTYHLNNWIPVKYPTGHRNFTVCFPSIDRGYTNAQEMVQTIEFNRELGAEKFFIYNMTVTPEVERVMRYYQKVGILEVLNWVETRRWHDGMIHYWAQETSMFDCLFRNLRETTWVVFADLDEVLVPRNHSSWIDLFRELRKTSGFDKSGSVMFLHAFFPKNAVDDMGASYSQEAARLGVESLLKTSRSGTIGRPGARSKQMVRPETVQMVGVHLTHVHLPGFKNFVVPVEMGLTHHYRMVDHPSQLAPDKMELDRNVARFHKTLLRRVSTVWDSLQPR